MIVRYRLTPDEFASLMRFHFEGSWKKLWFLLAGLVLVLLVVNLQTLSTSPLNSLTSIFAPLLIFFIFLIALFKLAIPLLQKRQFRKSNVLKDQREMEFTNEGFHLRTRLVEAFIKYEALTKLKINDEFILLYMSPASFHFIPTRAFENRKEKEELLKLVSARLNQPEKS